ncbi:MAG TPA: phospho-sugar mutase [Phycisphaerae bacterium]|nr:phospho-sugar mutase [Phycisphaerae bacterium]
MDKAIDVAIKAWLDDPAIVEEDKKEVRDLVAKGQEKELTDRFYQNLDFGTGGLRGIIGAGLNRMNVYTVGAAAQGLATYIGKQGEAARRAGVAIACDSRRMSDAFSRRTACVMAGNGITAYLFDALRPTPELSFAIRHLHCTAGVVITASHNPPGYNGLKAYWADGGQVVPPQDREIIEEVRRVGDFGNIRLMDFEQARAKGLIKIVGPEVDNAFLDLVQASCLNPEACQAQGRNLKIVYTPLHGTGHRLVPEALKRRGFQHVLVVPQQAKPDGEFPTVKSPNPEEASALTMALDLARREGADLVIGTDPDADRMGIAVRRPDGQFELVNGNRIAALMLHYICEQLTRAGKLPRNAVMITTIVSGDLMKEIARSYGAEVVEVLTGFKWIAAKLHQHDLAGTPERPNKEFIFGAEESYGYLPCRFVRDKDAVTSAAFIAEAAASAAEQGKGLYHVLEDLFGRFGYFQEGAKSFSMPGQEGAEQIKALMRRLRNQPPKAIAGLGVTSIGDVTTGEIRDASNGKVVGHYDLPKSDVLLFTLKDGTKVVARPSGTEPKIKFYVLTREPGDNLDKARKDATAKIESIIADVGKLASASP